MIRRLLAFLALPLVLAAALSAAPTPAQAQTAAVVASCGSASYTAGTFNTPTIDVNGKACGGANGDPVRIVATCGTVSPLYVAGQFNYPTADTTGITCTNASSGSGTVTSIIAGTGLSGGTITTTGTIALNAITANSALVNATGGSAIPSAAALPSCSTASSALTYTTSTGFGCNTISGSATVTPGQLSGLGMSNDGVTPNTILDVAAGQATNSTGATSIVLSGAFTKTTGAFVAGTGNGCLDTGAVGATHWYHVFLISKAAGASPDILCSLSATAPTMPSTYTLFRRIGSVSTNVSSNLIAFTQLNDSFRWKVNITDISNNSSGPGTSATLVTLSVPTGVQVTALFQSYWQDSLGNNIFYTSPDDTDTAPDTSFQFTQIVNATIGFNQQNFQLRTNTSSQIRARATSAAGTIIWNIKTFGWVDDRGMGIN